MISLEEHNRKRMFRYASLGKAVPVGIACPKCRSELVNPEPNTMLPSLPPKIKVKCPSCDFDGFAIR